MTDLPMQKLLFLHLILGISFTYKLQVWVVHAKLHCWLQLLTLNYLPQLLGSFMQSPLPASPQDVKWERWGVTQWGREGRGCSESALLQPSAGTQLCKCRTSWALPACLPCTAGNRISLHGKIISGWSSRLSMGHQKVGFQHKMGFI